MMKKITLITASGAISVAVAATAASPAFAWHPQGMITKTVQDVTTNSQTSSAKDSSTALTVAPGDTLLYTIVVDNIASPAANNDNDMAFTVMTDDLPDGIALTSNPSQRQITEDIGTIVPGKSVTKQYEVKVTDTEDGGIITNEACFTGDSIVKDNPQSGCGKVVVKVQVPSPSCNVLQVTQSGHVVTVDKLDTTAGNAVFKYATIDWGDHSAVLSTATAVGQTHQYADGTYKIAATAHFAVNGQDKTATSDACTTSVTFSTQPQLPNTGPGDALIPAVLAAAAGYTLYLINLKRRAHNS